MDPLPPFDRAALLLDLDGTLLDIAPTPDAVVVAPGLVDALADLHAQLAGALAIVTGRPVETVDRLLGSAVQVVAGEHGGAIRHAAGLAPERPNVLPPPDAWLSEAERLVAAHPGALLERKARGFALHYRACPEAGPIFHAALGTMLRQSMAFQLLPAHMAWEVRPQGTDKGRAVIALMERDPFEGRLPVFVGDDVTDEDGMRAARSLGGAGFQVAPVFGSPAGVRSWLAETARRGDWCTLPLGAAP